MNTTWEYADHSAISDGYAVLYKASGQRKNIVVGVNAGHGTAGGSAVRTLCHPMVLLRVQEAVRRLALRQQRRCQAE